MKRINVKKKNTFFSVYRFCLTIWGTPKIAKTNKQKNKIHTTVQSTNI